MCLNGTTSFTNCFMDPIVIRKVLLDLRGHSYFDTIGSARCMVVKLDNLAALQSIYTDKLAQKRRRPNTNMWLWLAEFVTNPFWICSISWLTRAPTRQDSRSERPQPTQHRGLIVMCKCGKSYSSAHGGHLSTGTGNLFRIGNNWVWLKCGETLKFSINKVTQSNDSRCPIL